MSPEQEEINRQRDQMRGEMYGYGDNSAGGGGGGPTSFTFS